MRCMVSERHKRHILNHNYDELGNDLKKLQEVWHFWLTWFFFCHFLLLTNTRSVMRSKIRTQLLMWWTVAFNPNHSSLDEWGVKWDPTTHIKYGESGLVGISWILQGSALSLRHDKGLDCANMVPRPFIFFFLWTLEEFNSDSWWTTEVPTLC